MKTSKPISTISYNTKDFLIVRLNSLLERRMIDFWAIIYHYAEEDERKNHFHVYMIPNGSIDTENWRSLFNEYDETNPLKPLGIMPIERSLHFGDWYLYCLHNSDYLLSKGQKRNHHYTNEDIISSDEDYLIELSHHIDYTKYTKQKELIEKIHTRSDLIKMVQEGQIPIQQMLQYQTLLTAIEDMANRNTFRNGKPNHEPNQLIDLETGEIIPETEIFKN